MKKKKVRNIISGLLFITILVSAYPISLGLVRLCAKVFAKADSQSWACAYISESPRARKYHNDRSCEYLQMTKYDIITTTVNEAEEEGFGPCKFCLEESRLHKYDDYATIIYTPILLLLIGLLALWDIISKRRKSKSKVYDELFSKQKLSELNTFLSEKNPRAQSELKKYLELLEEEMAYSDTITPAMIDHISDLGVILVNNAWFCCSIDAWMKTCNEMNRIKDQHLLKRNALVLLHCYWGGYYEKRFEHLASKNH